MKTTDTNHCPEGGHHSFILGRCFNCGVSIREHKARVKAARSQREREKRKPALATD